MTDSLRSTVGAPAPDVRVDRNMRETRMVEATNPAGVGICSPHNPKTHHASTSCGIHTLHVNGSCNGARDKQKRGTAAEHEQ